MENADTPGTDPLETRLSRSLEALEIASVLSGSFDVDAILREIVETAVLACDTAAGSLLCPEPERGDFYFRVATGDKAEALRAHRIPRGKGIVSFVATVGQPLSISDTTGDTRWYRAIDEAVGFQTRSILAVPVRHGSDTFGVLELVNKRAEDFEERDLDLAMKFADVLGIVLRGEQGSAPLFAHFLSLLRRELGGESALPPALQSGRLQEGQVRLVNVLRDLSTFGQDEVELCEKLIQDQLDFFRAKRRATRRYSH